MSVQGSSTSVCFDSVFPWDRPFPWALDYSQSSAIHTTKSGLGNKSSMIIMYKGLGSLPMKVAPVISHENKAF